MHLCRRAALLAAALLLLAAAAPPAHAAARPCCEAYDEPAPQLQPTQLAPLEDPPLPGAQTDDLTLPAHQQLPHAQGPGGLAARRLSAA